MCRLYDWYAPLFTTPYSPNIHSMQLVKHNGTLVLINENGEIKEEFILVSSVCFYFSRWFERHIRWQVQEDAETLQELTRRAMSKLTSEDLESIRFYENFYQELKQPSDKYNSSQKCITSKFGYTFSTLTDKERKEDIK